MDLVSFYLGAFVGIFPFTLAKVIHQTVRIVARSRAFRNAYLYMIWTMVIVCPVFAVIDFLYLIEIIPPSLGFYVTTVLLWIIQTQILPQIIINRIGLIMSNRRRVFHLKLGFAAAIGVINTIVGVTWLRGCTPGASAAAVELIYIIEYVDKGFFLLIDLGLNAFFLYLVHSRLIAEGLSKYQPLFKFNTCLAIASSAMDACLLGMLRLPKMYQFVQFVPIAYIVKLYIEMTNAALIAKIVRSSSGNTVPGYAAKYQTNNQTNHLESRFDENPELSVKDTENVPIGNAVKCTHSSSSESGSIQLSPTNVTVTTATTVVSESLRAP
ncbi:hypothetical protein VFPPC_11842 [Pochonia chlamydosporia 170]|uniref:Uncharacterized protein n=1 Tax=Pochonia chlamydosporia 170 TaxID=1380566 RepID=A0A179EXP2_METCM|nr:hypothetical protein VFPPC_11842 [Pochonia chlamydosporia 170]OAQ57951.1 hypothetical protein VFPPC_11842 [Pochonia chlamydosporia 170]